MNSTNQPQKQPRLSNVELLRIIAMFGVLTVHTDFGALHEPTQSELLSTPAYCLTRIVIESFALVSVNVFILISGWFGITFRWRGLGNLLFQTFFFFFGIYAILVAIGEQPLGGEGIYRCLMLSGNGWFVTAYLGMYILAPAINELVKHMPRKQTKGIIITLFAFQTIYGWISDGASYIIQGYGVFSFIGLYLLARYIKVYQPNIFTRPRRFDLSIYAICSIITASAIAYLVWRNNMLWTKFMYYTSPLVIIAALHLLLAFAKTPFKCKAVNKVAVSCFAVYLMHFMIFPTYMRPTIQRIAEQYNYLSMFGLISLLLIAFFTTAILVDRVRLFIWTRFIAPRFND